MKLSERLETCPLLRVADAPPAGAPTCAIILANDLPRLPAWLAERQGVKFERILIADAPENALIEARLPPSLGSPRIMGGVGSVSSLRGVAKLFLFMPEVFVRVILLNFPELNDEKIYISASADPAFKRRPPLTDYYSRNAAKLERVHEFLAEEADRATYAGCVKAMISGDPGYAPLSPFSEYDHPKTRLTRGDVLIDGGLSDMVDAQIAFAKRVGAEGEVYGFEPIPLMAEKAAEKLRAHKNYAVFPLGLADADGEGKFTSMRDSSKLSEDGEVTCRLIAVDSFVKRTGLPRVDALKLDVEGAEALALKGARNVIRQHKPKLIVCLYHKPEDLHEIPLLVKTIEPSYGLRLGRHSLGFNDTILYASV